MTPQEKEAAELAERLMYTMDRDFAAAYLVHPGHGLSDETLVALARAYAAMPKPEPTHCDECGQKLPSDE